MQMFKYILAMVLMVIFNNSCSHLPRSLTYEVNQGTSKVELKNILIYEYQNYFTVSADLRGASRHKASKNSKGKIVIKIYSQDKSSLLYEEESFFNTVTLVKNKKHRFYTKVYFNPKDKHIVFRVDDN